MAKRGRPRKSKDQKLLDALKRTEPNIRIQELRKRFSFVQPPTDKRLDGRNGEIDSEVCDALGQMCALGLLDGHGHDPVELRDKGRFWGGHYAKVMKGVGTKVGSYERKDRSEASGALTSADLLFDKMDGYLTGYERQVLTDLIVEPLISTSVLSQQVTPWAQSLIDEALLQKGRFVHMMRFPTMDDRARLDAAIRGLCLLLDGALPQRWAA